MNTKPEQVKIAKWMLNEYQKSKRLNQVDAVSGILENFGEENIYHNANGNLAINKSILTEFRKIIPKNALWCRIEKAWRPRQPYDS